MDATLKAIVDQLIDKTNAGKVNWQIGKNSNEFVLLFPESTFSISLYQNGALFFVDCKIVNQRGDVVLRENVLQSTQDGQYLVNFFSLIRDVYTGKDAIISSILEHIKDDITIGNPKIDDDIPF